MPRTILAHVNIEIADDDPRSADDVGDSVQEILRRSLAGSVEVTLTEEVCPS